MLPETSNKGQRSHKKYFLSHDDDVSRERKGSEEWKLSQSLLQFLKDRRDQSENWKCFSMLPLMLRSISSIVSDD